jgi:hypothetical protein
MDYEDWITRERNIRISILKDSLRRSRNPVIRICQDCGEICLCHELQCPNCNSSMIREQLLVNLPPDSWSERIRCQHRYAHIGLDYSIKLRAVDPNISDKKE